MYHYKVYYQYFIYGQGRFGNCEYSSKKELLTGDDYNELENFISNLVECSGIHIGNVISITKLSTNKSKRKEKQVEI